MKRLFYPILILFILLGICSAGTVGSGHNSVHLSHDAFNDNWVMWLLPFIGILLSIAIFPLIKPSFWHHHYGKVSLFWGLIFLIAFLYVFPSKTPFYLMEVYLHEFLPFIMLLLALFTVSGGILITGNLQGTPKLNLYILGIGTVLASIMGTTGASMLLIRPLIKANHWRKNKVHIIVFFIFLVSNIGGSLTPIGDPPLFLGFLKGVDFTWTLKHMFFPMLIVASILLLIFYFIDNHFYKKASNINIETDAKVSIEIEGKFNFILIGIIIAAVILSGLENFQSSAISYKDENIMTVGILIQILILGIVTLFSLYYTSTDIRQKNAFSWEPIKEVTKLFATIFLTMIPAITMLKHFNDTSSPLHSISTLIKDSEGNNIEYMYFWLTGILSAFLDNAPTYLVFFETARTGQNVQWLMNAGSQTLLAISCGAVFMGAMSYIGNAPNFMVKSISEENDIKMPSFFGYMLWSISILIPIFVIINFIIF